MPMRKIKNHVGFTLAETLMAVLILLLVSLIVANGIPVAKNAYEKVVLASNAQILLSTTVSALRDELGTARDVEPEGTTGIGYYSADTGARSRIYLRADDGTIMLEEYAQDAVLENLGIKTQVQTDENGKINGHPLVTRAASSWREMYVKYDSISIDDAGNVTFSGLRVYRTANDSVLADLGKSADGTPNNLTIRTYSEVNH